MKGTERESGINVLPSRFSLLSATIFKNMKMWFLAPSVTKAANKPCMLNHIWMFNFIQLPRTLVGVAGGAKVRSPHRKYIATFCALLFLLFLKQI